MGQECPVAARRGLQISLAAESFLEVRWDRPGVPVSRSAGEVFRQDWSTDRQRYETTKDAGVAAQIGAHISTRNYTTDRCAHDPEPYIHIDAFRNSSDDAIRVLGGYGQSGACAACIVGATSVSALSSAVVPIVRCPKRA